MAGRYGNPRGGPFRGGKTHNIGRPFGRAKVAKKFGSRRPNSRKHRGV